MQQALLIFLLVGVGLYLLLILFYRAGWISIPRFEKPAGFTPQTRITVVIPARNEAGNIAACLDSICAQTYPVSLLEVLVVDDHSTDDTAAIIQLYASRNVTLISLKDFVQPTLNSYKKKAIEIAIAQSTGELIVCTDADCMAAPNWLQTLAAFYEQYHPQFIAMPVSFLPAAAGEGPGVRFLKIFQSLDFMTLQGITGASVHKKIHSMCNGANLAYSKKAFKQVGGFTGIDTIASGDDMLLMHKIYRQWPGRVMFLKSAATIMQTAPVQTISEFFNQRIRWASKADKYDDKRIFAVLLLVYVFNVLMLLLPIIGLWRPQQLFIFHFPLSITQLWLWLLSLKTVVELCFLYPVARFFGKQKLLWFFPLMQPFHILYTVIAGWLGKFGKYNWKGRTVK